MQITSIGSGDGGKNSDAVYYFIFWGSFYLIFLNKRTFIASCRDLSPNRPFQELSVYYSIHQTSEIFEVFHSRMEPGSPERYHLPSDSGLYLLYLLFNLLQNTKDKRRAVCFAQNVFLSEKRFVLICEVFSVMAKMLSVTSQNLDWNVESLAKRKLYLKV